MLPHVFIQVHKNQRFPRHLVQRHASAPGPPSPDAITGLLGNMVTQKDEQMRKQLANAVSAVLKAQRPKDHCISRSPKPPLLRTFRPRLQWSFKGISPKTTTPEAQKQVAEAEAEAQKQVAEAEAEAQKQVAEAEAEAKKQVAEAQRQVVEAGRCCKVQTCRCSRIFLFLMCSVHSCCLCH